eukprot:TRINITY_DN4691_c2_g1_i3.p2 TRINITY_DN4691_c2_g1~~TRINITY_DN4691_c2_g1_i3.p2  ORF type:complete len:194 (-),score=23.74 TRINITY_DN4691_c2_g1_i3:262-843(-)
MEKKNAQKKCKTEYIEIIMWKELLYRVVDILQTQQARMMSLVKVPQWQRGIKQHRVANNHNLQRQKVKAAAETAEESTKEQKQPSKSLLAMKKFSEQYCKRTDTYFCSELSVTAVVIKGLAEHKDQLGAPLCPCRHYDDKEAEAKQGYWNCPCVPMRERKECHCMLFLTEDNAFAGKEQEISMEEIDKATGGM